MRKAYFCFTVDDVGYEGYSSEDHLLRLLEFCGSEGLKATLFTVPLAQEIPLTARPGYVEILHQAVGNGHEVAQHGLRHTRFETGIPPAMILNMSHEGPAREELRNRRAEIEQSHRLDAIRQTLRQGRDLMTEALGFAPAGFRAPCLAICDNLFTALAQEGYSYDSSIHLQPAGWDLLNDVPQPAPTPITGQTWQNLQHPSGVPELPLTAEYTWYLTQDRFDDTLALAKHDFDACLQSGIPFVPLCHVSPIQEGDTACGFEFYQRLLEHAQQQAAASATSLLRTTLAEAQAASAK